MKALLTTRCGCRREMEVTYPPPPSIVVPLILGHRKWNANEKYPYPDSGPGLKTRKFILDAPGWGGENGHCDYIEEDPA